MKKITFKSLSAAVEYAEQEGGWIFAGTEAIWFNAKYYTPSIILREIKGSGQLGTYKTFIKR